MTLAVHRTVQEFRNACAAVRARGARLGFVPTMGALHRGHMALVTEAARHANALALSIFVNPTQFGPNEDLSRYPRPLEQDLALCREAGVEHVFLPEPAEMYPPGERTRVRVDALGDFLCGPKRPGHFEGVATIVSKLFAVAGPCVAVFGRKDYQQYKIIERMTRDLLLPVEIVAVPTVRDADGVALSSRNVYLSAEERARAVAIPRALARAAQLFASGERRVDAFLELTLAELERAEFRVDYVSLADPDELSPLDSITPVGERALLAIAAFLGKTRLIDNMVLGEEPAPVLLAAGLAADGSR